MDACGTLTAYLEVNDNSSHLLHGFTKIHCKWENSEILLLVGCRNKITIQTSLVIPFTVNLMIKNLFTEIKHIIAPGTMWLWFYFLCHVKYYLFFSYLVFRIAQIIFFLLLIYVNVYDCSYCWPLNTDLLQFISKFFAGFEWYFNVIEL